jgi:flagellum-specific peptidoglycan hydrolase FlgJ
VVYDTVTAKQAPAAGHSPSHPPTTAPTAAEARYISRFAKIAQQEEARYGIPAAITIAQGMLESSVGRSRLARKANAHFGLKCWKGGCGDDHCLPHHDDSPDDRFRRYANAWLSYRDHSEFLSGGERYAHLFDLHLTDYRGWARGLQRAGYATDPHYADKLITLIERCGLAPSKNPTYAK